MKNDDETNKQAILALLHTVTVAARGNEVNALAIAFVRETKTEIAACVAVVCPPEQQQYLEEAVKDMQASVVALDEVDPNDKTVN